MREYLEWAILEKSRPYPGDRLDVLAALIRADLYTIGAALAGQKKEIRPADLLPDWTIDERTPEDRKKEMWDAFLVQARAVSKKHPGSVQVTEAS